MANPYGTMFNKGAAPVLERSISFLEQRHKLIAHNLANVETPYYQPVDLPVERFEQVLKRSMEARDSKHVKTFSLRDRSGVWEDEREGLHFSIDRSGSQGILRHGENSVDIDNEMAKLAENGMKYRVFSGLLKKQYSLLRDTIAERP